MFTFADRRTQGALDEVDSPDGTASLSTYRAQHLQLRHVTNPLSGQSYNRYSYVLSNPTNLIDRTEQDKRRSLKVEDTLTL